MTTTIPLQAALEMTGDALVRPLRYALRWRRMARLLLRLDERMLADIGVDRQDIDGCARRLAAARLGPRPALGRALAAVSAALSHAAEDWLARHLQIQPLDRLDDRLLRDAGLTRALIRGADRGAMPAAASAPAARPAPLRLDRAPSAAEIANENRLRRAS